MSAHHRALTHGVQAITDAEQLRMPGYDTRFAARRTAPDRRPGIALPVRRVSPRAWLAALRRPPAVTSH